MKSFAERSIRRPWLAAALSLGAVAVVAVVGFSAWPARVAEAQGIMSAPACQCSPATDIASLSVNVVHCICGAMSCVLSRDAAPAKNANPTHLMQCR